MKETKLYLICGEGVFGPQYYLVADERGKSYWENRGYDCVQIFIKEEDIPYYESIMDNTLE